MRAEVVDPRTQSRRRPGMNVPLSAGNPSRFDLDAADELTGNEAGRLALVRARAEKWVGGITALTGLLATVLVVKGPDSVTALTTGSKAAVGALLAAGLLLLAYATYKAYTAAFGAPGDLVEISANPIDGLAVRLTDARRTAATGALTGMRNAVTATFIAVGCVAGAVAVSWFAPTNPTADTSRHVCVMANGTVVAKFPGNNVAVSAVEPGTSIGPCP